MFVIAKLCLYHRVSATITTTLHSSITLNTFQSALLLIVTVINFTYLCTTEIHTRVRVCADKT